MWIVLKETVRYIIINDAKTSIMGNFFIMVNGKFLNDYFFSLEFMFHKTFLKIYWGDIVNTII